MTDFTTKTYTIAPTRVFKVTVDGEFLAYVKGSDASAKVVVANKDAKYIKGDKAATAETVNSTTGEYTVGSVTADVALNTAVELDDGTLLKLSADIYVEVPDDVNGTKFEAVGSNKLVKVGSKLRVVPKANTDVWSYLTKNGTPLADAVYNTKINNYDITVALTDVDATSNKLIFDQVQGVKVYIGAEDSKKIIATDGNTIEIASDDFKLYQGKTFVRAGSDYTTAINPTFDGSGDGAWTFDNIDASDVEGGAIYLVEAVEVNGTNATNMASKFAIKFAVGDKSFDNTEVDAAAKLYLPVGAKVTLKTGFDALGDADANVGKAIFVKLGDTGEAKAIEGEKNVTTKNGSDIVNAEAVYDIAAGEKVTISIDTAPEDEVAP